MIGFEPLQFDIPANVKVYGPVPQPPTPSEASNSHLVPLAQMAAREKVLFLCFYINLGLNAALRFFSRNIRLYILFVITLTWSVNSNGKVCSQNISISLCLSKNLKTCNGCNAQPSQLYYNGSKTLFSNVGIYLPALVGFS